MNKKAIIAVVVIVLVIIGYVMWGGKGQTTVTNDGTNTEAKTEAAPANLPAGTDKKAFAPVTKNTADSTLIGRLKNVSVSAAETGSRIALVNGKADFSSEGVKGSIALGDIAIAQTLGDVNYVATTIGVSTAGASVYQYAVLFTDNKSTLTDTSYALIGSGVEVTGLNVNEIAGGLVVTVNYTESGKTKTKILVVENGQFNSAKEINI